MIHRESSIDLRTMYFSNLFCFLPDLTVCCDLNSSRKACRRNSFSDGEVAKISAAFVSMSLPLLCWRKSFRALTLCLRSRGICLGISDTIFGDKIYSIEVRIFVV